MDKDKKKRAEKVRQAIINGAEDLGNKDDYGHGISNFYNSYKKINDGKGSGLEIPFSKIFLLLLGAAAVIFIFIYIRNTNLNKEIEKRQYIPVERENKLYKEEASVPQKLSQFAYPEQNDLAKSTFSEIETLIRLENYRAALSKIKDSLEKKKQLSLFERDKLRFYQSILLYNLGNKTRARNILSSLHGRKSSPFFEKIEFYYQLIDEK